MLNANVLPTVEDCRVEDNGAAARDRMDTHIPEKNERAHDGPFHFYA